VIILAVLLALLTEPQLPPGVTCAVVKAQVAEHGYVKALVWARSQGYSWAQIHEAKKCLR
jgi:hypothetical protein